MSCFDPAFATRRRDELTDALADQGLIGIHQRLAGLGQFVSARKPA